jgi:hypothetical protein
MPPELAGRMVRSVDGLIVKQHPDGRRSIDLQGRFLHMSAAVADGHGGTHIRCFSNLTSLREPRPSRPTEDPGHASPGAEY